MKSKVKKDTNSENPYIKLLIKLYKFLARRTTSKFNATILKRLKMCRRFKAPLSLRKLKKNMEGKEGKIAVCVGPVLDDIREVECPKMTVCALRFTETVRARILKAGGECLTFDQLALRAPLGQGTVLLRGPTKSRTAQKYMGKAPGVPNSTTRPRVRTGKGRTRKFEMARGRRSSRGYKN